jgi:hypothetical protein
VQSDLLQDYVPEDHVSIQDRPQPDSTPTPADGICASARHSDMQRNKQCCENGCHTQALRPQHLVFQSTTCTSVETSF